MTKLDSRGFEVVKQAQQFCQKVTGRDSIKGHELKKLVVPRVP